MTSELTDKEKKVPITKQIYRIVTKDIIINMTLNQSIICNTVLSSFILNQKVFVCLILALFILLVGGSPKTYELRFDESCYQQSNCRLTF